MKSNNIKILIESKFVPELSNKKDSLFYFSYKVNIHNNSSEKVQLLSRHWDIKDALGRDRVVDGEGVVGQKPIINPGSNFEYQSYCPLKTSFGFMEGFYTMKDEGGEYFKTPIPPAFVARFPPIQHDPFDDIDKGNRKFFLPTNS